MYLPERDIIIERHSREFADSVGAAAWSFFYQWVKNPRDTASLWPSGRQLTKKMLGELPFNAKRIVELGAGTGVFTQALLKRGIAASDLLVLELNQTLAKHLHKRFPGVQVISGDARELDAIATTYGFLDHGKVDAVLSGLGLLSMSRRLQSEILEAAFSVLKPGGCFIQFTYGPKLSVPRDLCAELGLTVRRGGFALWNLPPATVHVYTRPSFEEPLWPYASRDPKD